jgi:uncharacterized membrane protein YccC
MPAMFAIGDKLIGNPTIASFGAFGSFAMLLLVDFAGPIRVRLQDQVALAVVSGVLVCVGTLASRAAWLAALGMAIVGFAVLFAGIVSSALAAATTALLLAFIFPVSLRGPVSSIPDRLAGWEMAALATFVAITVLWPAAQRDRLRLPATAACRAEAERLRSDVAFLLGGKDAASAAAHDEAIAEARAASRALHSTFYATPYRPTGLSTGARAVVRLVDEVNWLDAIISSSAAHPPGIPANVGACQVKLAAATVLDRGADLLERPHSPADELHSALAALARSLAALERNATVDLPVGRAPGGEAEASEERITEFVTSLDPGFRSQELSFAVSQIAANIDLAAAAERRSWFARLVGRRPAGLTSTFSAAQERAASHFERHSVTLHNSVRGAIGLGLAVLVADLTGVQHSFWVVLGTLSVLRSNALSTGQNVVRGLLGTVAGFVIGAAVLVVIGTNTVVLWLLLPVSILVAGIAPAAVSFAAGQGAFTLVLVFLFNIIQPLGWRVGLVRVEDIAIGCGVSLAVGLLFWPRGAGAALGRALAEAYTDSARFLASAVEYGMRRCDATGAAGPAPSDEAARAAAASRRLDDTFRGYLAERGAKPLPLSEVTGLVSGVVGLRLAADAVLDLWRSDQGADGDRSAARHELLASAERVTGWYEALAASLGDGGGVPTPLERDESADARLVLAVRRDLKDGDENASATAVRMIWTGDHLDAARRLQALLVEPARAAARQLAAARGFSWRRLAR